MSSPTSVLKGRSEDRASPNQSKTTDFAVYPYRTRMILEPATNESHLRERKRGKTLYLSTALRPAIEHCAGATAVYKS
ncbi:hypothetical protein NECAME_03051 [Necator americanus]|uniref:Uncharacterized protein n=1 Tax=Necator americanus TaxID=51031 RepID=W2T8D1_NECAM|nr:hypothetical protein NECAME_03051 [Necator americanus]ETN77879.1 hypothetical protein NECAME_03051 [Necator americanus]